MKVGATVHPLRIQTHMEGRAVQTMTVASMMALHTPGIREMKKNEWDYCGQISTDDSLEMTSPDAMLQQTVMDTVMDKGNCILTEWILFYNNDFRPRANVNGDYIIAAREL